MYLKIKPHDPLFFRMGRPFNSGEDSWANTSLFPNPSVLWGAICSLCMAEGTPLEELEGSLKIEKIYLYNDEDKKALIPAPLDLSEDEKGNHYCERYELQVDSGIISSSTLPYLTLSESDGTTKGLENSFIDLGSLVRGFSMKDKSCIDIVGSSEINVSDRKLGIKRDRGSLTSEEGRLYRLDLVQFLKNWSFLLKLSGVKWDALKDKGLLRLGGEGKSAAYERLEKAPGPVKRYEENRRDELYNKIKESGYFKLLITSPAIFKNGWYPDFVESSEDGYWAAPGNSCRLKLLAASTGRAEHIGGFDIRKRVPKPMYRAIPAGSTYLFKAEGLPESREEFVVELEKSLTEVQGFEGRGFGLFELIPRAKIEE